MKTKSRRILELEQANTNLGLALAESRKPAAVENHYHDAPPKASPSTPVSLTFTRPDDEHNIRVAVLAISLMLKNRADTARVFEGSHVEEVIEDYARVTRLRELLGPVTDDELEAAVALWNETAE